MMLDVARKKHCRHTATAELALDGVRGAKAGLELLTQQFWHQQIDESPTNRICTVRARTRLRRRGGANRAAGTSKMSGSEGGSIPPCRRLLRSNCRRR